MHPIIVFNNKVNCSKKQNKKTTNFQKELHKQYLKNQNGKPNLIKIKKNKETFKTKKYKEIKI